MRSLVTGATGFLGAEVVRSLLARGDQVVALARRTSDRSRIAGLPVEVAEGDVTDPYAVERALEGADRVYHCAAQVSFGSSDVAGLRAVNVDGTAAVLRAAAAREIPTVHVSSAAALGPTGPTVRDESWWNPDAPEVPYEQTKREAHLLARQLISEGAPIRIAIPGGIYGAGDQSELGLAIRMYQRWALPVGFVPEVRHSTVNVSDCAEAVVRLTELAAPGVEVLVVAESVTMAEWFEIIARSVGHRPPRWHLSGKSVARLASLTDRAARLTGRRASQLAEVARMLDRSLAFSGKKARELLGWEPRPLLAGMRELAAVSSRRRTDR